MGYSDGSWKLTGNVADGATVTIKIASVGAYKGNISVQSAIFLNGAVPVAQGTVSGGALLGGIPEGDVALDGVGASDDFTLPPTADYPGYFLAQGEVSSKAERRRWPGSLTAMSPIPEPPTALLVLPPLLLAMWASRGLPNALAPRG